MNGGRYSERCSRELQVTCSRDLQVTCSRDLQVTASSRLRSGGYGGARLRVARERGLRSRSARFPICHLSFVIYHSGILLALLLGLIATAGVARADGGHDGHTECHGELETQPVIANKQPLSFGVITPSGTIGTATMSVSGITLTSGSYYYKLPSAGGGVTVMSNQEGGTNPGPAVFEVTGGFDDDYSIALPASAITLTEPNSGSTMTVDNFTASVGTTGRLCEEDDDDEEGSGEQYIAVGGQLHVAANQHSGAYTGTFEVTVACD